MRHHRVEYALVQRARITHVSKALAQEDKLLLELIEVPFVLHLHLWILLRWVLHLVRDLLMLLENILDLLYCLHLLEFHLMLVLELLLLQELMLLALEVTRGWLLAAVVLVLVHHVLREGWSRATGHECTCSV